MRTCQSCGKENPPDQDFCSCGEYLRWEPTGFVQAITPEMAAQAQAEAAPPKPAEPVAPAPPPPPSAPEAGNGHAAVPPPPAPPEPPRSTSPVPVTPPPAAQPPAPIPAIPKTLVHGAVPQPQVPAAAQAAEGATIVLRADPQGDYAKGSVLEQTVEPGERGRVFALIRNQSGIVDNYDLRIEGLPDDWWSIFPGTFYLVPFGAGGTY